MDKRLMEMPFRELTKFLAVFCVEFHIVAKLGTFSVANPSLFFKLQKFEKEFKRICKHHQIFEHGSSRWQGFLCQFCDFCL
jgi:hypothetical protein